MVGTDQSRPKDSPLETARGETLRVRLIFVPRELLGEFLKELLSDRRIGRSVGQSSTSLALISWELDVPKAPQTPKGLSEPVG